MPDVYDEIETEPWADVRATHERLLRDQLEYVQSESEYYRRRFREWDVDVGAVTSLEEFREIPFTTKADERDAQVDPPADRPLGEHQAVPTERLNRTISSSGTTGKPTYFGLTADDRRNWNEVLRRCFYTAGIRPDETLIFGAGQTMIPGGTPYFEGLTELGVNAVPAGGESTERLLEATHDVRGDVMFTTTSHLRYLTERVEDVLGYPPSESTVTKLVGGAGPGIANAEIRRALYDSWGAELVREIMGLGDVIACMWAECEAENGMHYHGQGHAHVELIDPETGTVTPFDDGAEGELVYTPLRREATPLIRFRSGDYVRITGTECDCGRTSPRMQCIGRTDDMLIYKGMNVFPSAIQEVVADVDGAAPRIRVVVPRAGKVNFEDPIPITVVRDPETDRSDEEIAAAIESEVRTRLKARVEPTLVADNELPRSQYKTDFVVVEDDE